MSTDLVLLRHQHQHQHQHQHHPASGLSTATNNNYTYNYEGAAPTNNYDISTSRGHTKMEFHHGGSSTSSVHEVVGHQQQQQQHLLPYRQRQLQQQQQQQQQQDKMATATAFAYSKEGKAFRYHHGASTASEEQHESAVRARNEGVEAVLEAAIAGYNAERATAGNENNKRCAPPNQDEQDIGNSNDYKRMRFGDLDGPDATALGIVPKKVNNEQWDSMFETLKEYKQEHGDCLVPKRYAKNPKLGTWVETQRVQFKRLPRSVDETTGNETVQPNKRLTADRLAKLESIGFAWSAKHVRKKKAESPSSTSGEDTNTSNNTNQNNLNASSIRRQRLNEAQWEDMYQRLLKFKQENGHCLVPRKHLPDPKLATWVETQRVLWNRDYRNNSNSVETGALANNNTENAEGNDQFNNDVAKKRLTPERKWKLDRLGFVWSLRNKRIEDHWDGMFQQLLEYKRIHGDCLVPSRYEANLKLGKWVETQRYEYTKLQRAFNEISAGTESPDKSEKQETDGDSKQTLSNARPTNPRLTEDRLRRLESIGFEWKVKHKMKRYYDKQWDQMFGRLLAFKKVNGHCMVPKRYPPDMKLGTWVHTQRIQYRKLMAGAKKVAWTEEEVSELKSYGEEVNYRLTDERRKRLEDIGFVWSAREGEKGTEASGGVGRITRNSYDDQWDNMFEQLKSYKQKYGDCLVPKRYKENAKLGTWVDTQRVQYKKLKKKLASQGKNVGAEENGSGGDDDQDSVENQDITTVSSNPGTLTISPKPLVGRLTDDRIRRLNNLGFVWSLRDDWQKHYDELKEYKKEHGHCNVPARYSKNRRLGIWVSAQRQQYKIMNQMSDSARQRRSAPLTNERIQLLNELGFTWTIRSRDSLGESWNQRLEELKEFKSRFGHCLVPSRYPVNPELGIWVGTQRTQYRLYMKSKETGIPPAGSTAMNEDRIRELEELGFVWALRNTKEEAGVPLVEATSGAVPVEDYAVVAAAGAAAAAVEAADEVMEHYVTEI